MNGKRLHITATTKQGTVESYEGTRPEIDAWVEDRFDLEDVSIMVTDDSGMTIGRKPFGESKIRWTLQMVE